MEDDIFRILHIYIVNYFLHFSKLMALVVHLKYIGVSGVEEGVVGNCGGVVLEGTEGDGLLKQSPYRT